MAEAVGLPPADFVEDERVVAQVDRAAVHELDAPVKRVGAEDTFVAYHPILEKEILPQAADLEQTMRELAAS